MYDTVAPSVIDDDMLMQTVEEQGFKDEAGKIAKQEGYDLHDVVTLRLDFKNILKIDNLWTFANLTKLQMDNNIIEKIEGLETLTKLVWLDLSFNNIEVIEGLDTLTELLDLSLFNNRITKLENMESLKKLEVFSIGNNDIKEIENIVYLRQFKELRSLNLKGNYFSSEKKYEEYTIAYLPQLVYLDYSLVDVNARAAATEIYQIALDEIVDNERKANISNDAQDQAKTEFHKHQQAFVENLNGSWLFEQMYAEDAEGNKLKEMPGVLEILEAFETKITTVSNSMFKYGMEEQERRSEDVGWFWNCVNTAKADNKTIAVQHINDFIDFKLKKLEEISKTTDQQSGEILIEDYNLEVSKLWNTLMGLELQLVDQLEEVVKEFERNLQDMMAMFIENMQGYLAQCREAENIHNEKMVELVLITLEKVIKNELDDEISDELRMFFVDKDTATGAVTASHDVHLLKIDNKEDDIITRANQWVKTMIETIHETEEYRRNRNRVAEINRFIDNLRDEIEGIEIYQTSTY